MSFKELGLEPVDIPEGFSVVINISEIDISNEDKIFQVVLTEEINNSANDILVGLAEFSNGQIKPFSPIVSYWDISGQLNPKSQPDFPIAYRKAKNSLVKLV
ncbi:hypothetical protein [Winogradskyella sp. PC D3.3]